MKYTYVCTIEDDEGKFFVQFPDLENVFTEGDTMEQAMELAADVLPLMLCGMEDDGETIPPATPLGKVKPEAGQALAMIFADTDDYRKKYGTKAVPRTLSLPQWMDTKAKGMGLSLSSVLQKALLREFETANA